MLNMALFECPVGFSKEIGAVLFSIEKKTQIDNQSDKNPKISLFQNFNAFFPKISTDFVNWNIGNGQQGKNVLWSMLS